MKPAKTWGHDELADDLAAHLKAPACMVWTNMQLGPHGSPRPDVYTILKSYMHPCPTAYECKISVSDFRSDITTGKWHAYLNYAHAVVFAAPAGLIGKSDVPEMCGLILRHENAWRIAKKATINPRLIEQEALLKLLIDGVEREGPKMRAKQWNNYDATRKFAARFGAEAARYVSDAAEIHRRIEQAEYNANSIREQAEQYAKQIRERAELEAPALWAQLLSVLGLESDESKWGVESAIRELRDATAGSKESRALRAILTHLKRIVDQNEEFIATPSGPAVPGTLPLYGVPLGGESVAKNGDCTQRTGLVEGEGSRGNNPESREPSGESPLAGKPDVQPSGQIPERSAKFGMSDLRTANLPLL